MKRKPQPKIDKSLLAQPTRPADPVLEKAIALAASFGLRNIRPGYRSPGVVSVTGLNCLAYYVSVRRMRAVYGNETNSSHSALAASRFTVWRVPGFGIVTLDVGVLHDGVEQTKDSKFMLTYQDSRGPDVMYEEMRQAQQAALSPRKVAA